MTTVQCCGEGRLTPFCPMCGNKLVADNPLLGLVAHCRTSEKRFRTELEELRICAGKDTPPVIARAKRRSECAERWKLWGDKLSLLIEGHDDPE